MHKLGELFGWGRGASSVASEHGDVGSMPRAPQREAAPKQAPEVHRDQFEKQAAKPASGSEVRRNPTGASAESYTPQEQKADKERAIKFLNLPPGASDAQILEQQHKFDSAKGGKNDLRLLMTGSRYVEHLKQAQERQGTQQTESEGKAMSGADIRSVLADARKQKEAQQYESMLKFFRLPENASEAQIDKALADYGDGPTTPDVAAARKRFLERGS